MAGGAWGRGGDSVGEAGCRREVGRQAAGSTSVNGSRRAGEKERGSDCGCMIKAGWLACIQAAPHAILTPTQPTTHSHHSTPLLNPPTPLLRHTPTQANAAVSRAFSSYACMLFNQESNCATIPWNGLTVDFVAGGLVLLLSIMLMFTTAGGSTFSLCEWGAGYWGRGAWACVLLSMMLTFTTVRVCT